MAEPAIVVHGGAGRIPTDPDRLKRMRSGAAAGVEAGYAVLAAGGSALDAVEAAVVVLEDDPEFNAGRGAALTEDGGVELDASVMEGTGRYVGAVGSRKTQAERRRRLLDAGVSIDRLSDLRGPIGLDLGGRNPSETALAIIAEIVAERYGGSGVPLHERARAATAAGAAATAGAQVAAG